MTQLVDEISERKRYRPQIPFRTIHIDSETARQSLQNPDAVSILLRIASVRETGARLEELSEAVNEDFPRLLRAIKQLIKAQFITMVWDRCFIAPASYSVTDQGRSPIESSVRERHATSAGSRLPIHCYFPSGSFGYDLDDDEKCTAVRMIKAGLAAIVDLPPERSIVLDPSADTTLGESDIPDLIIHGACLIDTPWYRLPEVTAQLEAERPSCKFRRLGLPPQTNAYYQTSTKTSTAAAAAYVTHFAGCVEQSKAILDLFEWGQEWKEILATAR
jgi:ribosome biogenesis protein Tsr3